MDWTGAGGCFPCSRAGQFRTTVIPVVGPQFV